MAAYTQGRRLDEIVTAEVMSNDPITCHSDDEAEVVLAKIRDFQVRRLPVVDDDRHVIGIVSIADLVRAAALHPEQAPKPAVICLHVRLNLLRFVLDHLSGGFQIAAGALNGFAGDKAQQGQKGKGSGQGKHPLLRPPTNPTARLSFPHRTQGRTPSSGVPPSTANFCCSTSCAFARAMCRSDCFATIASISRSRSPNCGFGPSWTPSRLR